jgi:hypothetical protein
MRVVFIGTGRTAFLCVTLLFLCHLGHSQNFSLGVKAGPLLSWASFGDKADRDNFKNKAKPGYFAAGFISFPLKDNYSFQTEVGFSQRGRKVLFSNEEWENNATYYYIDMGMLLRRSFKFNLGKNIPANWFINVGPHINYWLGGKGEVTAGGSYSYTLVFDKLPTQPTEPDFDKMYLQKVNRWLFGIDFGLGFNAPLKNSQRIFTELRFHSGHTFFGTKTSASNRTLGFEDNLRANQKTISLSVAYVFDFNLREQRKGKSTKDKETHRKIPKRRKR